jgi:hypothetical protein
MCKLDAALMRCYQYRKANAGCRSWLRAGVAPFMARFRAYVYISIIHIEAGTDQMQESGGEEKAKNRRDAADELVLC